MFFAINSAMIDWKILIANSNCYKGDFPNKYKYIIFIPHRPVERLN